MEVFLAAPFLEPELLRALVGDAAAPRPAELPGFGLGYDPDRLRIGLVPDAAGTVAGGLVRTGPEGAERLAFVMACLGARAQEVTVQACEAGSAGAFLASGALPAAGAPPEPGYLREVVAEIVGHHRRTEPARMPALLHGISFRAIARLRGRSRAAPGRLGSGFGVGDVEVRELAYAYADYFGVEERLLRHRRFDGEWSGELRRSVLASGDAVTVLPFDPRRQSVLLVEQFRAGAHARRDPSPWFLEAVAGRCDGLEPTEETARREALEEAGLTLGRLERIAAYYTTPGIAAEFITAYVGEADLGRAGGLHGLPEESEDIRALVVPLDDALAAVACGEIANAPLLLSLLWLQQHRARLAAAWA